MIGKKLAHYEITALLGKGGMGEVYRAADTRLGREVAIKVLPAGFGDDEQRLARFQREARTLAVLQHPNVASIYGLENAEGHDFLVMELVEGEDLAQRLARGALPPESAVEIARQVATGLEAAHDKGIVHRDLKPANIKLGADGSVKILDFGLARAYAEEPSQDGDPSLTPTLTAAMTRAGMILGTAAYMSPEQARGLAVDRRTDIFSFGIVLYEMLSGSRAFGGDTMSDTVASILKEEPDRAALPQDTPPAVTLLLDRCLEKDPKRRLRDVGEARLILEAVLDGDTTASRILGAATPAADGDVRGRSRMRGRELVAWLLAAAALLLLAVVGLRGEGTPPSPSAVAKFAIPIPDDVDLRYTHGGLVISPDGRRIAYINQRKLHVRPLDSWDALEIPHSEDASSPFWSPDGAWLAFAVGKDIWRVRPDGTQRQLVCTAEMAISQTSGGAWLADDRIVFRGRQDLMVAPASGGNVTTFAGTSSDSIVDYHEPEALPGGEGLVTVVHRPEGVDTIGIVSLDGTLANLLTIPGSDLSDPCYAPSGHVLFQDRGDLWAVALSLADMTIDGDPFPVERNTAVPTVSRDGTLTYVRNAGRILRRMVLVDRSGTVVQRLGQPEDFWGAYALAPDGSRAVGIEAKQEDLYLHDDRQARSRLTFTDLEHDMPAFSWDGSTVYFATGTERDYRIGGKVIGRNEPEKLLVPAGELGPHYYAACPAATRDGKRLFYTTHDANGKQDIAWLDLDGDAQPRRFLAGDGNEYAARPSPADDRVIAYVSEESGSWQVYLTAWPDGDQKLAVSIDGGIWPRWREDGRELYFALGNEILAVDVSYDPLIVGRPQVLFSRPEVDDRQPFGWPPTFDVTANGERFLVTELAVDAALEPEIAVIQNWRAGLD